MTRASWHTFVSSSPCFGTDEDSLDPFFEPEMVDRAATRPPRESLSPFPFGRDAPEFPKEHAR